MVHAQAKFDGNHWLLRWNGIWCESGSIALVHRSIQSALKMTSISSVCYQVDGDVPVHRHRIVHWNGVWLVSKVDNGCKNAKYSLQNWSSHWHNTVKRIKSSITCGAKKKDELHMEMDVRTHVFTTDPFLLCLHQFKIAPLLSSANTHWTRRWQIQEIHLNSNHVTWILCVKTKSD